jgi:small basic protein
MSRQIAVDVQPLIDKKNNTTVIRKKGKECSRCKMLIILLEGVYTFIATIVLILDWNQTCDIELRPFILLYILTCVSDILNKIYQYFEKIYDKDILQYSCTRYTGYSIILLYLIDFALSIYIKIQSKNCSSDSYGQYLLISLFLLAFSIMVCAYITYLIIICTIAYYAMKNNSELTAEQKEQMKKEREMEEFQQSVINNVESKCSICYKFYNEEQDVLFVNTCKHHYHKVCYGDNKECLVCSKPTYHRLVKAKADHCVVM